MRKTTAAFRQTAKTGSSSTAPESPTATRAQRSTPQSTKEQPPRIHLFRSHDESGEYAAVGAALGLELPWSERSAATRERGRRDLQRRLRAYFDAREVRVIATDNRHTMLSIKRSKTTWSLRMHHMFIGAPPTVVRAVARYAQAQCPDASQVLRRFIDDNDDRVRMPSAAERHAIDVEGRFFNLREIYDEINAEYFNGEVDVQITWGQRGRRRRARESIRLGSYTLEDRLIRIHPVLDASDVPAFFVKFIVFHEMLHSVHEMPIVGGRRVYHTEAFRAHERLYAHYDASLRWERRNLHKLLE
ncbi:MAG: hypothetical protein ACPHRO_08585, partial [Nannocystaceae bacterium]